MKLVSNLITSVFILILIGLMSISMHTPVCMGDELLEYLNKDTCLTNLMNQHFQLKNRTRTILFSDEHHYWDNNIISFRDTLLGLGYSKKQVDSIILTRDRKPLTKEIQFCDDKLHVSGKKYKRLQDNVILFLGNYDASIIIGQIRYKTGKYRNWFEHQCKHEKIDVMFILKNNKIINVFYHPKVSFDVIQ